MSTRTRNALAVLLAATLLGVALLLAARSAPSRRAVVSPLQAVPAQAPIVVVLRLDKLRASPFSRLVSDASTAQNLGSPACSARMLDRVREAALFIAEGSEEDFGLAALGDLSREALAQCARQAIGSRGGLVNLVETEGFTLVEDHALGQGAATLAVREGGPLLLARPVQLSRMIAAIEGRTPSAYDDGEHARMRSALQMNGDVVVTAQLSNAFRQKIRAIAGQDVSLASVLAVAGGIEAGPTAHVRVLVWCNGAPACDGLAKALQAAVAEVRDSLAMRVAGVAGLLQSAVIRAQNGQLVIDVRAPAEEIVTVLQRLWRWDETFEASAPPVVPMPALSLSDEVLRAPRVPGRDGGR